MNSEKKRYVVPNLETEKSFIRLTGISIPIGTDAFIDPFEQDFLNNMDFMEGSQ
jgi:hypothetical protein